MTPTLWPVHAAYRVADGVLHAEGEVERHYPPADCVDLPSALGKLADADDDAIVAFTTTYGLLGEDGTIALVRAHARTARTILDLGERLQDRDRRRLRTYLRTAPAGEFAERDRIVRRTLSAAPALVTADPGWVARAWRATLIKPNLTGIDLDLLVPKNRDDELFFSFPSLIAAIYWRLATEAVKGTAVKRCEHCGHPFIQREPRNRFCPRPRGEPGESLCALAARNRRRPERRKGGAAKRSVTTV